MDKKNIENEINIIKEQKKVGEIKIGNKIFPPGNQGSLSIEVLWLYYRYKDEEIYFSVLGYGHGVGMSQFGAMEWQRKENLYRNIKTLLSRVEC